MNAVNELLMHWPRDAMARALRALFWDEEELGGTTAALRAKLARRFELDLAGLLNLANREELDLMAAGMEVSTGGAIGELRARLWIYGAEREAEGMAQEVAEHQPVPIVLRGKLVHLARERGISPPARKFPRPIPAPKPVQPPQCEPDTVEDLLERAEALLGARLGRRGRDKGVFGVRVARLLGVRELGHPEPDWRGEVEIKTVPVVRDRSGWWRVKEDPAVSMEHAAPLAKLQRVLWIARVADDGESPVLSWYYQEWDAAIADLVSAHLHTRPKGGAGATTRGWYLHKRFFTDSGFLRSLNG